MGSMKRQKDMMLEDESLSPAPGKSRGQLRNAPERKK